MDKSNFNLRFNHPAKEMFWAWTRIGIFEQTPEGYKSFLKIINPANDVGISKKRKREDMNSNNKMKKFKTTT